MSERKRHYAVEKLSHQGKALVDAGLERNDTYDEIVAALKKKTGESLAISSLQRYHARKWFPNKGLLEETNRLHGLVKGALKESGGKKLDEVTSELLKTLLFNALSAIKDPDPTKLYQLVISEGWLDVEKEKLGIHKQRTELMLDRVKVLRGNLRLREEQWNTAKAKAERAAKAIDEVGRKKGLDAQTLKKIREEVYGIVHPGNQAD